MTYLGRLLCATALVLAAGWVLAGCSGGTSLDENPPSATFVGRWHLANVDKPSEGWDIVFKEDETFDGYVWGETSAGITGTYAVDSAGACTGDWTSPVSTSRGKIEATLESDTVMYLRLIVTNAYDNPNAVNGYMFTENRGSKI